MIYRNSGVRFAAFLSCTCAAILLFPACGKRDKPPAQPAQNGLTRAEPASGKPEGPKPAPTKPERRKSGSLTVKWNGHTSEKKESLPVIRVDRSNVRILPRPRKPRAAVDLDVLQNETKQKWSRFSRPADDSSAMRLLPDKKNMIEWRPLSVLRQLRSSGISFSVISADSSILLFAEPTGGPNGPNGTRLILWNTHSWEVVRLFELPRIALDAVFHDKSGVLYLRTAEQPLLNQKAGIASIDPDKGIETDFRTIPEDAAPPFVFAPNGVLLSARRSEPGFLRTDPGFSAEKPLSVALSANPMAFRVLRGSKLFAAVLPDKISIRRISDGARKRELPLPPGHRTARIYQLFGKDIFLLVPDALSGQPCRLYREKLLFVPDVRESAGIAAVSPDRKRFVQVFAHKGMLLLTGVSDLKPQGECVVSETRPFSDGRPAELFFLDASRSIGVLDSNGRFQLMHKPMDSKRWQKDVIFTPMTAGAQMETLDVSQ